MASDSLQGSHDYDSPVPAVKLVEKNGIVYAICGYFAWFDAWIKWHEAGADPEKTPICKAQNHNSTFIVFKEGRCFTYDIDMPYPDEAFAGEAFGSGRGFAMGAMAFGATAKQAVAAPKCEHEWSVEWNPADERNETRCLKCGRDYVRAA